MSSRLAKVITSILMSKREFLEVGLHGHPHLGFRSLRARRNWRQALAVLDAHAVGAGLPARLVEQGGGPPGIERIIFSTPGE